MSWRSHGYFLDLLLMANYQVVLKRHGITTDLLSREALVMLHNRSESLSYWPSHEADLSVRLPSLPCRHPVVEKLMSGAIIDFLVASYRRRAQFTFFCGDEPR